MANKQRRQQDDLQKMLKMEISRLGHLDAQGKKEKGPPSYEPKNLRSVKLRDVEKVDDRIKRDEL